MPGSCASGSRVRRATEIGMTERLAVLCLMGPHAMSEESGLLRGIARSPDDDAPRLVYADWLDDHGRADRAEFIRAQIQLAGILRATPPPDGDALDWPFV